MQGWGTQGAPGRLAELRKCWGGRAGHLEFSGKGTRERKDVQKEREPGDL